MMTHIIYHPNLRKSSRNILNTLKSPVYPALIPSAFLPTFHYKDKQFRRILIMSFFVFKIPMNVSLNNIILSLHVLEKEMAIHSNIPAWKIP